MTFEACIMLACAALIGAVWALSGASWPWLAAGCVVIVGANAARLLVRDAT